MIFINYQYNLYCYSLCKKLNIFKIKNDFTISKFRELCFKPENTWKQKVTCPENTAL